jgi:hypothetical protein
MGMTMMMTRMMMKSTAMGRMGSMTIMIMMRMTTIIQMMIPKMTIPTRVGATKMRMQMMMRMMMVSKGILRTRISKMKMLMYM